MFSKELRLSLLLVWPLLLGLHMIMIGSGLQGTLLALRASVEGFPVYITGVIMSLYFTGFLFGCYVTPKLISSVGHIRVFAALGSIASTVILLHGAFVTPWFWGLGRILSGISFAGLHIVAESWLNNMAVNKLRGRIFGSYVFASQAGLFFGQFLILFGSIEGFDHFIIVSILVSLALVPVTLANKPAPGYEEPEILPLKKLIRESPMANASVFISGLCVASLLGVGPVYATQIGLDQDNVAYFMGTFILGCAIIPFLSGWISDRVDRRRVLTGLAFLGCLIGIMINLTDWFYVLIFIFGGLVVSLYSVGIAYMNDNIKPGQVVSATTSMILVSGIGSIFGPFVVGFFLEFGGAQAFFYSMAAALLMLFFYGIYRDYVGKTVEVEEQGEFVYMPSRSAITPRQIVEKIKKRAR